MPCGGIPNVGRPKARIKLRLAFRHQAKLQRGTDGHGLVLAQLLKVIFQFVVDMRADPTYREVCSSQTGHAEVVRVVFDPQVVSYKQLLQVFWENHDPAQGMRQGGDVGTQYRSAIYTLSPEQQAEAESSLQRFQQAMDAAGDKRVITTEIAPALPFYYAEDDHQQYLFKNPEGYCGLGGIGVCLPPQG